MSYNCIREIFYRPEFTSMSNIDVGTYVWEKLQLAYVKILVTVGQKQKLCVPYTMSVMSPYIREGRGSIDETPMLTGH